ncbi:MAG TPA: carboxypeptidase-like regulatory domain-containing protein, partial [Kofleriaceae bacterium]|nr:carboxypeptidase-like regulatory domain-containing protein [Kofleriaceae bacterium]
MKAKTSLAWLLVLLVLAALAAWWLVRGDRSPPPSAPTVVASGSATGAAVAPAASAARAPGPRPGAEIAEAADAETAGGVIDGRVLNGVTREGVPNAELSFLADGGVSTVRTGGDGAFELRPPATGTFVLSTITAPGFLPYAPELGHSSVRLTLMRNKAVHGVTLLLYPAVEYQGLVVDARSAPVAGARVRLLGSPSGEQVLEGASAEWKTGRDGRFTFHAAPDAVLEARSGNLRGWARIDRAVALRKKVTIQIGNAPARDATISGHVRDDTGAPVGDALVRAEPSKEDNDLATVFATTGPDGAFTLA